MSSASATSVSPTLASAENFQIPRMKRSSRTFSMQLVPRHDGRPEARVIDADEVVGIVVVGRVSLRLELEDRRRLRERLDDEHTRHHRVMGKVSLERRAR